MAGKWRGGGQSHLHKNNRTVSYHSQSFASKSYEYVQSFNSCATSFKTLLLYSIENTLITVTRKRFSSSSFMAPLMLPIAQHRVFRLFHVNWLPVTCRTVITIARNRTKRCCQETNVSFLIRSTIVAPKRQIMYSAHKKKTDLEKPMYCKHHTS